MTGDVLAPVLITFLVVNVILLIRAGAMGRLRRLGSADAGRPPEPQFAAGPSGYVMAAEVVALDASGQLVAAETVAPDPPEIQPAPPSTDRDMLTGLDDEAAWDRRVADETARVRRYPRPVTIVRLELDGLERLTGLLGEEAGDRLLRAMADTVRRLARDTDHVARLGQGGFAFLMPETSAEEAVGYVERVSRACELWLESGAIAVRLAVGWAATVGDVGLPDIQRIATERMHGGQLHDTRRAGAVAAQGSVPTAPVADVPTAPVADVPTAPVADVPTAPVADVPTAPVA
ncbi:MAG: GGDEF domain-containing protein, partial [Chloroflexi bacterium]|nr:GGDEF domain-containing protein [Chloroflexota bacterium]